MKRRAPKFLIWYAIWAGEKTCVFRLMKSKAGAKRSVATLSEFCAPTKFGFTRLIEKPARKRRRRTKRK